MEVIALNKQAFYWEIKNVITQFLAAFDDVVIGRFNKNRVKEEQIKVRYVYAPKQRVLFDIVNKAQNLTLPVISVHITSIQRDEKRVFNKLGGMCFPSLSSDKYSSKLYMPVPVNVTVNMSILTHYQTDMDQIISNFVAYNNPYIIITWKVPAEYGLAQTHEIRSEVEWNGNIALDYPIELAANTKARITGDTSFTIKGWIFQEAPSENPKNIFFIDSNFHVSSYFTEDRYTTLDDYGTLSAYSYTYPVSTGLYNELEVVSISAAPTITNLYFSNSSTIHEMQNPFVITHTDGVYTLIGNRFQYTTNVFISANNLSFLNPLTAITGYTYYPAFSAYRLDPSRYQVLSPNIINIELPTLTASGYFDFIVANGAGWGSSQNTGIRMFYQP